MRFRGNLVEDVLTNDESLKISELNHIYFKNFGSTEVSIGMFTLKAYEETTIDTGNISISTTLNISFNKKTGGKRSLYYRAIQITGIICD